ncbi:Tom37 metaxin N-terminal-like domain-containing protein [Zhongshania sp.]|uniref:Tom37 metaxin N-terminal-like domain-containing protein n=1 Tax=Zhongshania sp. TaxID=1971902 RepID=UPI003566977B
MITLYGFKQAYGLIDANPFVLKVDAFLRMAKLPYKLTSSVAYLRKSLNGKLPFIEDGDAKIGDSSLIFEYLNQKPDVTLNDWLSAEPRAQAYLIGKSLDENFYWCLLYSRWICDDNWPKTRQVFLIICPFHSARLYGLRCAG